MYYSTYHFQLYQASTDADSRMGLGPISEFVDSSKIS